jgi:hypothetical protein
MLIIEVLSLVEGFRLSMVACACNPSTWEVEAGRILRSRPAPVSTKREREGKREKRREFQTLGSGPVKLYWDKSLPVVRSP